MAVYGDADLYGYLHRTASKEAIRTFGIAGNQLADTMHRFKSIDEALHWWSGTPQIVTLGKLAIATLILKAEATSLLAFDNSKRSRSIGSTDSGSGIS